MISHGYKTCVIETLKFDHKDIKHRQKQPHVIELADSIKKLGALEPPVINRKTKVLIAGRDRVAAYLLNEMRTAWFHLVDADAKEMEAAERAENLFRRPVDRDALMAEEIAATEKTIIQEEKENPPEEEEAPKKGRKKTAKGKAREVVAKKAGKSTEAVRKAEERARRKKGEVKPKERPAGIKGDMLEIRAAVGLVVKPLISAQSATKKLLKEYGSVMGKEAEPALQRLDQRLHECFSMIKFLRPDKVCTYCKGERLIEGRDCSGCGGAGYLTEGAAEVPEAVAAAE